RLRIDLEAAGGDTSQTGSPSGSVAPQAAVATDTVTARIAPRRDMDSLQPRTSFRSVEVVQRRDVAAREVARLGRAEAGVHERAPDGRAGRRARDVDRADAGRALVAAAAAADAAVEV